MELVSVSLTHAFIHSRSKLTWREALFGLDQGLISDDALVDLAAAQLETPADATRPLLRLAGLERSESARTYVAELASLEAAQPMEELRDKWLYLVLSWLYEHRDSYADPLAMVENVYADFDYPPAIASFVRYMPTEEPDLGSRELNEARLLDVWKSYLDAEAETHRS